MKAMIIGAIAYITSLAILAVSAYGYCSPKGDCYSAWTEDGVHLIISDNGTPDDLEDDFICDYETNRVFEINVIE